MPLWILATISAPPLVIGLTAVLPYLLTGHNSFEGPLAPFDYGLFGFVNGAVAGVVVGSTQWLLLRSWIHGSTSWITMTTLGWAGGSGAAMVLLGTALPLDSVEESRLFAAGVVCGTIIGLGQWLFLRHQIRYAAGWPVVTGLGWVLGLIFAAFVWPQNHVNFGIIFLPAFGVLAVPRIITFGGLWFLLYRTAKNCPSAPREQPTP